MTRMTTTAMQKYLRDLNKELDLLHVNLVAKYCRHSSNNAVMVYFKNTEEFFYQFTVEDGPKVIHLALRMYQRGLINGEENVRKAIRSVIGIEEQEE